MRESDYLYRGNTIIYKENKSEYDNPVVIKELVANHPPQPAIDRLNNEYEILNPLNIKGVRKALNREQKRGLPVLTLEYIEGKTLKDHIKNAAMGIDHKLELAIELVRILLELHLKAIIHNDLNSSNVLVSGSEARITLIDFGSAVQYQIALNHKINVQTMDDSLFYLSPEQLGKQNRKIDYRADLYSCGVILYELFTGKLPFYSKDPQDLIHKHVAERAVPLTEVKEEIPEIIGHIVQKLLAKDSGDRYQSALGLQADLEECLIQFQESGKIDVFTVAQYDPSLLFQIPDKLYGREEELQLLLNIHNAASDGRSELILITGDAGIGKTALVKKFQESIESNRVIFIEGKYDQYKTNIPFTAISMAFHELVLMMLSKPDDIFQMWKKKILKAVGDLGKVIIDVVPSVELIIGKQREVPQLGRQEAQSRFNYLFRRFVEAISSKERPLILFIDDLQWIDAASLNLLKALIIETEKGGFLIIGAYRDDEIDEKHPLTTFLKEVVNEGSEPQRLKLRNLRKDNLDELVADTLQLNRNTDEISELLYQKTRGNPFFARRLLQTLYEEGHIRMSSDKQEWEWHIDSIRESYITEDVVALLSLNIEALSLETKDILKLASCIGEKFALSLLSSISGKSEESILSALKDAITLQFIHQEDDIFYFMHDRVQQAIYSVLKDTQRSQLHLKIGRHLLSHSDGISLSESVFKIVDHMNIGARLVTDEKDSEEIARLNLMAAQKAREATAFDAMLAYVNQGLGYLGPESWETQYELTLEIHQVKILAEFLNIHYESAEKHAQIVLERARTLQDKIRVHETLILSSFGQNRMKRSIDIGIKALKMLGVFLSDTPPEDFDFDYLFNLPEMKDPEKLACMRILKLIYPPVLTSMQQLVPHIIYTLVELTILHGNSPYSAFAYAVYGMYLCWDVNSIEEGFQFAKLAMEMLKRFESSEIRCRIFEMVCFVLPWKEHLRVTIARLHEVFLCGLQTGDREVTSTSRMSICIILYYIGDPLDSVCELQAQYLRELRKLKYDFHIKLAASWSQLTMNLSGRSDDPKRLKGKLFDEDTVLSHPEKEHGFALFYIYLAKTILSFWIRDYRDALIQGEKTESYTQYLIGFPIISLHAFFYSLILLKVYQTVGENEQKEYMKTVNAYQKKMKAWAHYGPMNFQHRYDLVEAEKARVLGIEDKALHLYEKAIKGARKYEYLNDEALCNELAAEYCLERGFDEIAGHFMRNAYLLYKRWGITVRIKDLESRYSDMLMAFETPSKDALFPIGSLRVDLRLDLESIIKASHALSSETNLKILLTKMMNIIMENIGAGRGVLLLKQDNQWFIQAKGDFNTKKYTVLNNEPYLLISTDNERTQVPESVINLCIRKKETYVIDNALKDHRFTDDTYIKENNTRSILCMPLLHKSRISGILYLENSLASEAFSEVNVETLRLLSMQFSISLENALLYHSLTERLSFEKLLAELSASFVNLPSEDIDKEIAYWLKKLVYFLGVDRGSMFEFQEDDAVLYVSHYHVSPGVPNPPIFLKQLPWYTDTLLKGKMIALQNLDELPGVADREKEFLLKQGIKSYIAVPMSAGGLFLGLIEFASFHKERKWSDEFLQRLCLVEGIFANAMERKKNEEKLQKRTVELKETAEKLKNLSLHLQEVREQERANIAREIHDEFGQALTVLKMDTSWIEKHFNKDPKGIIERIKSMHELIDSTIKTVQRISRELRPEILDYLGLTATVEWHAEEFQKREGILTNVICEGEEITSEKHAIVLFRILQETLTNISRHARATQVDIHLTVEQNSAILEISDNGRGVRQEEINNKNSLGLIGMRERVSSLHGKFEINGKKSGGTKLKVILPLQAGKND